MFKIDDLIVYGNTGVCRIVAIGPPSFSGVDPSKDYYTLAPFYSGRSTIFIPCDNEKVVMRPLISKKEAKSILSEIEEIGFVDVPDERHREEQYKEVMKSCDCRRYIGLIKTICSRKNERLAEGKKITANDEKYFQMAEDKLCGELAIALDDDKLNIRDVISKRVEAAVAL